MGRRLGFAAILSLVVAYAALAQGPGWNQNAHYALVRALANHTPVIEHTRYETGKYYGTGDISVYHGHTYSNKAPGFAFATLPAFLAMKAVGKAGAVDYPTGQLWFLTLWGAVLPAFVMLLLVRRIGEALEPGMGTVAALLLGICTLLMQYAAMFFSHTFSAMLGFSAFALLWFERRGPPRLDYVVAAGMLVGYAVTTEFPDAITAAVLGLCVLARPGRIRRALAYGAGALVGLIPLFVFNQWAFGSPLHLSYQSTVGFGATHNLFLSTPSFRRAVELMFANVGLLRTTPVLALAAVGVVLLYRRGHRFEALSVSGMALAFLLFESSYEQPFGASSGPRQLIPILPFLALPLAAVFRRMPLTTLALGAASAVEMGAVTITHPIDYWPGNTTWFHQVANGDFSATVLSLFGRPALSYLYLPASSTWYPLLLFFVPIVVAVVLATVERPRIELTWQDASRAAACLLGWLALQHEGPKLLNGSASVGHGWAPVVVLMLAIAVALVAAALPQTLQLGGRAERAVWRHGV